MSFCSGRASSPPHVVMDSCALGTVPARWPTPPRSEASCGTTVSEPQHSGGGHGGVLGDSAAGPEHSSRSAAMDASPALQRGGGSASPQPNAVIAGGADEGQQPLPDPLASHPRYRKIRDLNW